MLQDPMGVYEEAGRRHAELYGAARAAALAAALRPAPRWRLATAGRLRRIADRLEGLCTPAGVLDFEA